VASNKVFEYTGPGVATLTVPERATITNMGAELGATTSVFPSDEKTKEFLTAQDRAEAYAPLAADADAVYDQVVQVDLSTLEPLVACPHSPDAVKKVSELEGMPIHQVAIGSCTNSSWLDMMKVAAILKGKTVADNVEMVIAPGSRHGAEHAGRQRRPGGYAGRRRPYPGMGCGPCIGMGQSPCTDGVSPADLQPELQRTLRHRQRPGCTCSARKPRQISAIEGVLANPLGKVELPDIEWPQAFKVNDNAVVAPAPEGEDVEVIKGPNIKPFPLAKPLKDTVEGKALIVVEGQHHHGPHHALRRPASALPLQHPLSGGLLPDAL